ncbi:MAG TPA: bifunctional precorrin-2 dehydrogenase/sirohydrochlorin ferrochelatase [Acidobacteriaceae bacterium]
MAMFPIYLKLQGRPCLVVGAGKIAVPKVESLVRAAASVTVVAPEAADIIAQGDAKGELQWLKKSFVDADLDGKFLVVAATNLQSVNHAVAEGARARNILCNSVDDPPDCDFFYPSVVQRGDLQIAISTAGKSPALAQSLRLELERMLPGDVGVWLDMLGQTRERVLGAYPASEARKEALHLLANRESCDPACCPVQQKLDELLHGEVKRAR